MRISRIMFWTLTCSVPLTVAIMVVLGITGTQRFQHLAIVLWLFILHLALATLSVSAYERNRGRRLTLVGVAAGGVSFVLWSIVFGRRGGMDDAISAWMVVTATPFFVMAAYAAGAAPLLHLTLVDRWVIWLRRVVFVLGAFAGLLVCVAVAGGYILDATGVGANPFVEWIARYFGIFAVVIVYLSLLTAAGAYLRVLRFGDRPLVDPIPVRLTCPRCEHAQLLKTEGDSCSQCGLQIKVAMA